MKRKKMDIQAMMFDLDGTLIDSVPRYFHLMASVFDTIGLPPPPKSLIAEYMSYGKFHVFEKLIPDELEDRKGEIIQQILTLGRNKSTSMFRNEVNVFPGVRELFDFLGERDIQIGIVSSTERHYIDKKLLPLDRLGLTKRVDAIVAIGDTQMRKPAPDPLIECARRLAVLPEQSIYVGDSQVDIIAGAAAEMMTIGVLSGLDSMDVLKRFNPTWIVPGVDDIRGLFLDRR